VLGLWSREGGEKPQAPAPKAIAIQPLNRTDAPLTPLHILDDDDDTSSTSADIPIDQIFIANADDSLLPTHPEPFLLLDRRGRIAKEKEDQRKKDKAAKYKKLLPLGGDARRHKYGANFQPSAGEVVEGAAESTKEGVQVEDNADDGGGQEDEEEEENSNRKTGSMPSQELLKRWFEEDKEKYESEVDEWRDFEWEVPEPHESLERAISTLDEVSPFPFPSSRLAR